ncbi:MAG: hypothetical protein QOH32_4657, partial [Bradyrhizobium sp.]|nr:hypothetical protein [Bradyrhizobium sp.]
MAGMKALLVLRSLFSLVLLPGV